MIIGITGRGGAGKTTLAKKIVENHQNFYYIEVDKLIDAKFVTCQSLFERANNEVGVLYNKTYVFEDLRQSYFGRDEESRKLHQIFIEELNNLINAEIEMHKDKNIVVEYFFLDKFDAYKNSDIKIHLHADLEERVKRVKHRGNMDEDLFLAVDSHLIENTNIEYDFSFNILEYQSELVSIVIPVYNGAEFIGVTLDSILNQTYKNLEIVIVNDGSTDNTLEILEEYQRRDSRIKIITTPNMNVSNARNTGLNNINGEYVAFIDSDDIIDKNYIAALYDTIKVTGADYAHSSISIERANIPHMVTHKDHQLITYDIPINSFLKRDTVFAVWSKLFKRELVSDIKFDNINCFEDFKYMWEVSKKSKLCAVTNDTKYHYIQRNNNSLTSSLYNKNNRELINHAFKVLEEAGYSDEAKRYFYGCLFHNVMLYAGSLQNPNFQDEYKEEILLCIKYLEKYKDYEFQLIEYNMVDVDKVIKEIKEHVGVSCIAVIWNSMQDFYDEALEDIERFAIIDKALDINFSAMKLTEFLEKIYPHVDSEYWKTQCKINSLVNRYDNNNIKIVYLTLPKNEKRYDKRKKQYAYPDVVNLKHFMRNKYSIKVSNYSFDNVFHMTDDEYEFYITDSIVSELFLNGKRENGYIVLDSMIPQESLLAGSRSKYVFNNFIFKEIRENTYEDYVELFNEEVLKLLGIKTVFYDLAKFQNKKGVITNLVNNSNAISGYELISAYCGSNDINEIMNYNDIMHLLKIIEIYILKNNGSLEDYTKIMDDLYQLFCYDLVMLQTDRNPYNWGIMKTDGRYELFPVFDNSNCANFNHPERNPYNGNVLLKYNSDDSYNVYVILHKYQFLKEDVLRIIRVVVDNIDYIFKRIEVKTGLPVPLEFKKQIINIYSQHFTQIQTNYQMTDVLQLKRVI